MQFFRARFAVPVLFTLLLAACGHGPTTITAPQDASYDGGHTFGGGNRSDTTMTTTTAAGGSVVAGEGEFKIGGGN